MSNLYAYSLLPVLSVALLLFFSAVRQGARTRGLAAYCLSVALWSGMLALLWFPSRWADVGERFAGVGAFVAAGYLHAAYDVSGQRRYGLVYLAYGIAGLITAACAAIPGLIYGPGATSRGPLFWPTMGLAAVAATVPLTYLGRAYRVAVEEERASLRLLFLAGLLSDLGGMGNAVLLAHGLPLPFGMIAVLIGLLLLANVIRRHEPAAERRLLERSLVYSALAALLTTGFFLGVLSLLTRPGEPFLAEYRLGGALLLFTAALAFEPVRQLLGEAIGRRVLRGRAPAHQVAQALVRQEERADQAERLAELGVFASAVAHEIRNPLGVLSAHLKLLSRSGAPEETLQSMEEQIQRATRFVEDLLRYGRPRPLELRFIDLGATLDLALSTARSGLGAGAPTELSLERRVAADLPLLEADQAQLSQVLVVLIENALLALCESPVPRTLRLSASAEGEALQLVVEDSGPGIPEAILPRLFEPFVSGRRREGPRPGTGLGLAIARRIVERHHGRIRAGRSPLGGARFDVLLPRVQPVLGASPPAESPG